MQMFIVAVVVVIAFIIIFLALAINDREESKKDEKQNMIDEFILYEIVLPDYPFVAYQFSEELIISIKNYVKEIRGNQK